MRTRWRSHVGRVTIGQQTRLAVPLTAADVQLDAVARALRESAPGKAWLDAGGKRLLLRFEPGDCPVPAIVEALKSVEARANFDEAVVISARELSQARAQALSARWRDRFQNLRGLLKANPDVLAVAVAGLLLLGATILMYSGASPTPRLALLVPAAVLASLRTAPTAWQGIREMRPNVDMLMFAAAIGAAVLGKYEEGGLLLFLFGAGAAGEHLAMSRAESAIRALASLAPTIATVRESSGDLHDVAVEQITPGQHVVVRPFARIPLDGVVIEGASTVDESSLTGESVPIAKEPGAAVFAGTMNSTRALVVRVTRAAADSTVARIMRLVIEAQAARSPVQTFTANVERWYVPLVFVATAALTTLPPLLAAGEWAVWFYRAMAFMTAASPCALALGTPAAVLCGTARAARMGVLVKSGAHLETLARVRGIAYDKTGTLTHGKPRVTEVVAAGHAPDDVLSHAAAVESRVTHPLADAIVAEATSRNLEIPAAEQVHQVSGRGAEGRVNGLVVAVEKPSHVSIERWPQALRAAAERAGTREQTLVLVTFDEAPVGLIALADRVRPEAASVIRSLRQLGVKRHVMLTGDHPSAAAEAARQTGVDEYHASLRPEQKLEYIAQFQREYHPVAMVGDGVNDAPALAAADVGIAMGATRNDVALETADAALLGNSLEKLPAAVGLGRTSNRIIGQNLLIALGVMLLVAPLAALGYAPLGVAVLLHEGSTLVVVLNALRLLRFSPERVQGQIDLQAQTN